MSTSARWGKPQQGFSLIELVIAVLIVGILSGIAIPAFAAQKKKAYLAAAKEHTRSIPVQIEALTADGAKTSDLGTFARAYKNAGVSVRKDGSTTVVSYVFCTNGQAEWSVIAFDIRLGEMPDRPLPYVSSGHGAGNVRMLDFDPETPGARTSQQLRAQTLPSGKWTATYWAHNQEMVDALAAL